MIEDKRKKRVLLKQFEGYVRAAQANSKGLKGCLEKIKSIWQEICDLEDNSDNRKI